MPKVAWQEVGFWVTESDAEGVEFPSPLLDKPPSPLPPSSSKQTSPMLSPVGRKPMMPMPRASVNYEFDDVIDGTSNDANATGLGKLRIRRCH